MTQAPEYYVAPRVNIAENDEAVTIEAEMPGVARNEVDIEIKDNELLLKGKRRQNGANGTLRLQESARADFYRAFRLSRIIDTAKVEAKMTDGILTLRLPKIEEARPRVITVN